MRDGQPGKDPVFLKHIADFFAARLQRAFEMRIETRDNIEQRRLSAAGRPDDNCDVAAAPIRDSNGKIVAAVSMSAFENYIAKEQMDANIYMICETARQISSCLGYMA